jgi:transketolase
MNNNINELCKQLRYNIIRSTTEAGTGHPTSSLSAVSVMATVMFGGYFKSNLGDLLNPNNDRLLFSKGHASPLLYSLYYTLGEVSESEIMTVRKFDSVLEGHPTMRWQYTEAATGSLGQGLGVAVGMALSLQKDFAKEEYLPNVWCLLGDSEMAEGSIWESMNCASYYHVNNLIAIVDLNRLGQRGETQIGHDTANLQRKAEAFGWQVWVVEGDNLEELDKVFGKVTESNASMPKMVIAKTFKGAGISFLENKEGWHGKALPKEEMQKALDEIGPVDLSLSYILPKPMTTLVKIVSNSPVQVKINYEINQKVATRKAFGNALNSIGGNDQRVVALDAEMNNSTYTEIFAKNYPEKYYEMFIAEQNMISVATGMARLGKIPVCATFAAFMSRAFDQIRMSQYSYANIKIMGSHCGVSIGPDGSSQMAVEDISMFRAILGSTVLYPCDAVSADRLTHLMIGHKGLCYLRGTRAETPVIYSNNEEFVIGGSKTLVASESDQVTILTAGITIFEALKAVLILGQLGIKIRVLDMYSIKPIDKEAIKQSCKDTQALIVVEDHYPEGGLYEAVLSTGIVNKPIYSLSVKKMSRSGTPEELLAYMEIDSGAIVKKVLEILKQKSE